MLFIKSLCLRGLLGRKQFGENEGLVIIPCNAVHTIGMAFALDLLFLARDGTVLQLEQDVRPWRMRFCLKAHAVVELHPPVNAPEAPLPIATGIGVVSR